MHQLIKNCHFDLPNQCTDKIYTSDSVLLLVTSLLNDEHLPGLSNYNIHLQLL